MAGPRGRKRRKEEPEEHENHERWMVTYADMVTLLMVLFIVMFSMSAVDERKYQALKDGLAAGFGQSAAAMDGSQSLLDSAGTSAVEAPQPKQYAALSPEQRDAVEQAVAERERLRSQRAYAEAEAEVDRLRELMRRLDLALRREHLRADVESAIDERGLVVSLVSRHVVFEANEADLTSRGRQVVGTLARVLRRIPDPLQIDGHTNQVPVKPRYFDTDWDLAAARSLTVLRHLNEQEGIPGSRLTASSFGHEKPLVDPAEPGSQRVNKRVDIVILSSLSAESRELIENVVRNQGEKT